MTAVIFIIFPDKAFLSCSTPFVFFIQQQRSCGVGLRDDVTSYLFGQNACLTFIKKKYSLHNANFPLSIRRISFNLLFQVFTVPPYFLRALQKSSPIYWMGNCQLHFQMLWFPYLFNNSNHKLYSYNYLRFENIVC